tara:strand:- start:809 stop:1261 length:453 start_codon:yes stop_codon:yes gene_type:complete
MASDTGYRNINRTKQGKHETLSIGFDKGKSNPKVRGYTGSARFTNCRFIVRESDILKIHNGGQKAICAWFVGTWIETPITGQAKTGRNLYHIYQDVNLEQASSHKREISINPRGTEQERVFHYRDTLDPVDVNRSDYEILWTNNRCYIAD